MKKIVYIILAFIIALIVIVPILPLIFRAISRSYRYPMVLPKEIELMSLDKKVIVAIFNSLYISFWLVIINLILALPAARVLSRMSFRAKGFVELLIYSPIIVPPFIAIMGMHFTFISLSLTESFLGIILIHIVPTLPYMIRALSLGFDTIPANMDKAAYMLGAQRYSLYSEIYIPILLPSIISATSLTIIISLAQYLTTLIIGSGRILTLTILIFPYLTGGDISIGSSYILIYTLVNLFAIGLGEFFLRKKYRKNIEVEL